MKKNYLIIFFLLGVISLYAQDTQLGSRELQSRNYGGYFDYSDPEAINIKVSVWGFVNFPGKYLVPSYSTVTDLISYAGGPNENAELDDVRLYRRDENGKEEIISMNYNDFMWENSLNTSRRIPPLKPSDIVIVTGTDRLYFNDYLSIGLSIFSALISLTILILNINN